jgi:hypothetical protein
VPNPTRPDVSDPALKAALESAGPAIEDYHTNLDAISRDIKSVEEYLSRSGIRVPIKVRVYGSGFAIASDEPFNSNWFSGEIYEDDDYLEWSPISEGSDRWRIMHHQVRHFGSMEIHDGIALEEPSLDGRSEELAFTPLIETPVAVRLRVHRGLANLVEEIGKQVQVRPLTQPTLTDDEIPF